MAEVFSDNLNLNIGDLLLNPLYHATSKHRARLFMLMHVCARAISKLRASLTSAPIVASDFFSNPLSYISKVARQLKFITYAPVAACWSATRCLPLAGLLLAGLPIRGLPLAFSGLPLAGLPPVAYR